MIETIVAVAAVITVVLTFYVGYSYGYTKVLQNSLVIEGPEGPQGPPGPQGERGPQGEQGPPGR